MRDASGATLNDSLGHRAGDVLLQAFGARLRAQVRETERVARLGGDEFTERDIALLRISADLTARHIEQHG